MFNLNPMSLKLVWETGELDPPSGRNIDDDEEWGFREIPDFKAVGALSAIQVPEQAGGFALQVEVHTQADLSYNCLGKGTPRAYEDGGNSGGQVEMDTERGGAYGWAK